MPRHSITSQIQDLPKYLLLFNWPYVALDIMATLRIRNAKDQESGHAMKRPAMGAVIGMTIPYALAYSLWPIEMSSSNNDAGQGVGILLIVLG